MKNKSFNYFFLVFFTSITCFLNAQTKDIGVGSITENLTPVENRYAFLVGIDHYDDPRISSFKSCRLDVANFETFLVGKNNWALPQNNIVKLNDPTKERFIDSFTQLLDKIPNPEASTFYFFYSGHGLNGKIVPANYIKGSPENLISYNWVKKEINTRGIKAKVFVLDACYSGSIIANKDVDDFNGNYIESIQDKTDPDNFVIFTASNNTTPAGKDNSFFTKHFLNSLKKITADKNQDSILTSGEVYDELYKTIGSVNSPEFAGSRVFPMATFKKQSTTITINPESSQEDSTSNISKKTSFSIERDGTRTNWGYLNADGNLKIPFNFKNKITFYEGLANVKNTEGFYGYINKKGETIIPFIYEHAKDFSEGLAAVTYRGKDGFIDKFGIEVIPFKFYSTGSFSNGLCIVQNNSLYDSPYFINNTGDVATQRYYKAEPFSNNMAAVKKSEHGNWTFINKEGNLAIPDTYSQVTSFSEGLASVRIGNKWGVINTIGEFVIEPKNWVVGNFFEGKASVLNNSRYGFINTKGNPISSLIFEDVKGFSDGLAAVKKDDKWGYIDGKGELVIKAKYRDADKFENGYARVTSSKFETWIINKTGECIFGCKEGDFTSNLLDNIQQGEWLLRITVSEVIKRAKEGNVLFQRRLGRAYTYGSTIPRDYEASFKWYKLAADNGDALAQNRVGLRLSIGTGIAQNKKEAVIYYQKSAEQGYEAAQYNLGYMYLNGKGIEKDTTKANYWFKRACSQGYSKACDRLLD